MIINGLKDYAPFNMLLEDFEDMSNRVDDNWHLIKDGDWDTLRESRITKLAASSIINILDSYQHDYDQCAKRIAELENPDKIQSSYYDSE